MGCFDDVAEWLKTGSQGEAYTLANFGGVLKSVRALGIDIWLVISRLSSGNQITPRFK